MATTEDALTVAEAARLLGVAPATVRRRVQRGELPSRRNPANRMILDRADVLDRIAGESSGLGRIVVTKERIPARLTPEEQRRGLAAAARLRELQDEMIAERGSRPFSPPNWQLINEGRDERTRQIE